MRSLALFLLLLLLSPAQARQSTVGELLNGMKKEIRLLGSRGAARVEYERFRTHHNFHSLDYWTYLKSKVAFECCRDAGLWHILWRITDREPNSKVIWKQWAAFRGNLKKPTASAECDEVSALYALVARQLGVRGIGLFWPTGNHTVAVWTVEGQRIVVPTTPIFLERHDGFDAEGFDPTAQPVIYDYTAQDVSPNQALPDRLVRFFISQIRNYGGASQELLHELRYLREGAWRGQPISGEFEKLKENFTGPEDKRALKTFARQFSRALAR